MRAFDELLAAPAIALVAGGVILRGETYTAAGSFTDPGNDVWSATVSYGDGAAKPLALTGKTFALSNRYSAAGTYTVSVSVNDGDGGTGNGSAIVRVLTPQEGMKIIVGG